MGFPLRVLIVDDSGTTRSMLREALTMEGGLEVVGEARSGRQAIARSLELGPDVVLMDVRMADGNGAEACREIIARLPETRVVALTWSDDPATVRDMASAGAAGYVVKGASIDELVSAIRAAGGGHGSGVPVDRLRKARRRPAGGDPAAPEHSPASAPRPSGESTGPRFRPG